VSVPTRITQAEAASAPLEPGRRSSLLLNTPGLEVRWYTPPNPDPQTPHDRDEIYLVTAGSGFFRRGDARVPFAAGDMLFAAAGEAHRFEDHTPDTQMWVVFGPGA
jgi:mannose-6-phosphate isomerase-like protein (cupin superfamily)